MTRIDDLIKGMAPDGVPYHPLRSVCTDFIVPMRDRPKVFDGDIPWCRIEDIEGFELSTSLSGLFVSEQVVHDMNLKVMPAGTVIASCSASLGRYAITTQPLVTNQTFIGLVCGPAVYNRFLLHLLHTKTEELTLVSNTATVAYIPRRKFEELLVPVPPLEIQCEIVRILDKFAELEAELQAELEARQRQYEYYRDLLVASAAGRAQAVALRHVTQGGLFTDGDWVESRDQDPSGSVRLTQLADVGVGVFLDRSDRRMREDQAARLSCTFLQPADVLIARMPDPLGRACQVPSGIGRAVTVVDVAILRIARPDIDPRYVMHAVNSKLVRSQVDAFRTVGTRPRISRSNLGSVRIPIPTLSEQRRIAEILDAFDALLHDLSIGLPAELAARRKQYEYYRDRLLTFEEAA